MTWIKNITHVGWAAILVMVASPPAEASNAPSDHDRGQVELVGWGKARARIVPASPSDAVSAFAATELRDYVKRMSGAKLSIAKKPGRSSLTDITFELAAPSEFRWDSYSIDITTNSIRIRAASSRGLLYGTYEILERLGCAWTYPGRDEEIAPRTNTLLLKTGKMLREPAIERRGLALYGLDTNSVELGRAMLDWMAKNRFNLLLTSEDRPSDAGDSSAHGTRWRQVADKLGPEAQKRGLVLEMSEHSTHLFFPRSLFTNHPDWFSLNAQGQRVPGQMCYSNPDAIEYYANRQAEYAAQHPEISILGTWPLDGGGYCRCTNCQQPDTVFKMVAKVAEKVGRVRPDLTVEHLAYKDATFPVPTTVPVPENVSVLLCGRTNDLGASWVAATHDKGGAYYFEYRTGDNWYWAANIWLRPAYVRDTVQSCAGIGFRGITCLFLPIQNWWRSCFNFYFMGRAYWDPQISIDSELHSYCAHYYGDQAGRAYEIFKLITDDLQNDDILKSQRAWAHGWPEAEARDIAPEGLKRSFDTADLILARLDQAERDTADAAVRHRLERIRTYVEYFRLYYEARRDRSSEAKSALVAYAAQHSSAADGVCVEPAYVNNILYKRPILFK